MKISSGESQRPQTAEVCRILSTDSQHPLLSPKPGLGSSVPASLSILSTWSTWTSSGFSLSCWKQLPSFILALSTLNVCIAVHGRLFGAWFALCLPAALSSPLGELLDTEKESQQQQQGLLCQSFLQVVDLAVGG